MDIRFKFVQAHIGTKVFQHLLLLFFCFFILATESQQVKPLTVLGELGLWIKYIKSLALRASDLMYSLLKPNSPSTISCHFSISGIAIVMGSA